MEEHEVRDSDGTIKFRGVLLGSATSRSGPANLRWTELHIFRTEAGTYVVNKIGRTRAYHVPGEECAKRAPVIPNPGRAAMSGLLPCPFCGPYPDDAEVALEVDRSSVQTATSASGCVESCKTFNHQEQTVFLTNVARRALEAAAQSDEAVAEAFYERRLA